MFTKLLVPLDGSTLAEQAIGRASAIARASGAELELVLVHHPFPSEAFEDAPWNEEEWNMERSYLESMAGEISAGASMAVARRILSGPAVESICQRAREIHADLIVMTSHGRTGFSRAWLGSVADGVIRHSSAPVLMLRVIEGKTAEKSSRRLFSRILVPLDGSTRAAEVLPTVRALAACSDARVALLRVVHPVPMPTTETRIPFVYTPAYVDDAATKRQVDEANEYLADLGRRFREESGLEVEGSVIVADNVAQAILDVVRGQEIDLVALATHGRGASRLLAGSVADKLLRGSDVPMLSYRPLDIVSRGFTTEMAGASQASALTQT